MRLHSKFHDYYDTSIAYGIDPDCHYVRKTEDFKNPSTKTRVCEYNTVIGSLGNVDLNFGVSKFPYSVKNKDYYIYPFAILFCGKVYRGVRFYDWKGYHERGYGDYVSYLYSYDDMIAAIESTDSQYTLREYTKNAFKMHFDLSEECTDVHFETGVPVIAINDEECTYNPVLKTYQFYKIMDAPTTFQEISMFISGVLGGNSPKMVKLDDKDLISKHGFDKHSFRKMKTKRV